MSRLLYKDESYEIIGICMEIHRELGPGFLEIVYQDALEYELKRQNIPFEREKAFQIQYKDLIMPHKFYADFEVFSTIILEIKAVSHIIDEHLTQTLNYLALSKLSLGLIINFGQSSLIHKRVVL